MTLRLPVSAVLLAAALTIGACAPEPAPAPAAPEAPAASQPAAVAPAPASPDVATPQTAPAAPAAPAADAVPVYLDVRTPEEYAAGHVEGAVLVPYDQIAARIAELEPYRDRDMVVYCRTGRRSGIAIETLRANGFTRLTNGGGLEEVVQTRNLPVATGN